MIDNSGIIEIGERYVDWEVTCDIFIDEYGEEKEGAKYVKINNLFVPQRLRGNGFAKQLLSSAIALIKQNYPGMNIVIVAEPKEDCVDFSRLACFYESMGLEVISY